MRRLAVLGLTCAASLAIAAGSAHAVMVDMGSAGRFGVALVPNTDRSLVDVVPPAPANATCNDPWLTGDLSLNSSDLAAPHSALCWHVGGAVMHGNETFALSWDPKRRDWATTRNYVERFLRDVSDASNTLTSPYAVTAQYKDGPGPLDRANNASLFGGGCIDYGAQGGASCKFRDAVASGAGLDYPTSNSASNCTASGTNQFHETSDGGFDSAANDICLTDAQVQAEVRNTVNQMGLIGRIQPGFTPLVVLRTPPGVVTCLDKTDSLCSANSDPSIVTAQFCSYHSHLNVNGTEFAYLVQPWTASWTTSTGCDEPDATPIPDPPPVDVLAQLIGQRLVSPLSQAHIAAIVNPWLNGWYALDGSEINDNGYHAYTNTDSGCRPLGNGLDKVTVGTSSQNPYLLQREFNNAGVIETDPNALRCSPNVLFAPTFVVPSPVNPGDAVAFDGSVSVSTLMVSKNSYFWKFGDGSAAVGPTVVHSYARGGTYTVTLTVVDRGGNARTLTQTIAVRGSGAPAPTPASIRLRARLQVMPQGLRAMLRSGMAVQVSANEPVDGIASLWISRSDARRAHLRTGRAATVVVGRGTVSGINHGTKLLHVHLPRATAKKLSRLRHLTVTVRLALVAGPREHVAIAAAGRY